MKIRCEYHALVVPQIHVDGVYVRITRYVYEDEKFSHAEVAYFTPPEDQAYLQWRTYRDFEELPPLFTVSGVDASGPNGADGALGALRAAIEKYQSLWAKGASV